MRSAAQGTSLRFYHCVPMIASSRLLNAAHILLIGLFLERIMPYAEAISLAENRHEYFEIITHTGSPTAIILMITLLVVLKRSPRLALLLAASATAIALSGLTFSNINLDQAEHRSDLFWGTCLSCVTLLLGGALLSGHFEKTRSQPHEQDAI